MSALSGVPVVDLQWLVQSGVEAFLNMPPSALFPVPAEVSAQTFFNASRNFLWRLGFATIRKSDARMLLNSARLWAKVNNASGFSRGRLIVSRGHLFFPPFLAAS